MPGPILTQLPRGTRVHYLFEGRAPARGRVVADNNGVLRFIVPDGASLDAIVAQIESEGGVLVDSNCSRICAATEGV